MASRCFCALRRTLTVTHSAPPRRSHNFTNLRFVKATILLVGLCLNHLGQCNVRAFVSIRCVYFDVKIRVQTGNRGFVDLGCNTTRYCAVAYI